MAVLRSAFYASACGLALSATLGGAALAQEPVAGDVAVAAQEPVAEASTVVYDQAYFARFNPTTAEDLLRRVPGVPAILDAVGTGNQDRGLGSGGDQILIGGRRFPGKTNDLGANLRRIPAGDVERVELLRGTSSGVDVQSKGTLVNIILKDGANLRGSGNYELNARFDGTGWSGADGLVSYSGSLGAMTYVLGVERNVWGGPREGQIRWSKRSRDERYYYPGGALQELRPQAYRRDQEKWNYTGSLNYEFKDGGRLGLNGLYQTMDVNETDVTPLTRYSLAGAATSTAVETHVRVPPQDILELGGQYERSIGRGKFNSVFIVTRRDLPVDDRRDRVEAGRNIEISRSELDKKTGEDIVRASYAWPVFKGQTLEIGAEGARNKLSQNLHVFQDRNADGLLEEVVIPTALARVKEVRAEFFANHNWTLTSKLTLQSSLTYEGSKITNNYPFSPERKLGFVKPRVDLRYQPANNTRFRFLVERTISQLDFSNFVPAFDFVDNEVDAGNPGLDPEKTWVYEVGYERRLAKDGGVIEARAFYNDITDALDKIPLLDSGGKFYSALGNLDHARSYGAEGKASLRLDRFGLRDAVLSGRYLRQTSQTTDPFTLRHRRVKNDRRYSYDFGFRQDLPKRGLAYGLNVSALGGPSLTSDIAVVEYFQVKPVVEAFVERKLPHNLTLRMELQNLSRSHEVKARTLYAVSQMNGVVRRLETYDEKRDIRVALRLRGKF